MSRARVALLVFAPRSCTEVNYFWTNKQTQTRLSSARVALEVAPRLDLLSETKHLPSRLHPSFDTNSIPLHEELPTILCTLTPHLDSTPADIWIQDLPPTVHMHKHFTALKPIPRFPRPGWIYRSRSSRTKTMRPMSSVSLSSAIARCASSGVWNSTRPQPLDRPSGPGNIQRHERENTCSLLSTKSAWHLKEPTRNVGLLSTNE